MLSRRTLLTATAGALVACAESPLRPDQPRPLPLQAAATGAMDWAALAPPLPRETRAAWVATVGNIDWPSRKGLKPVEQQAEMFALLDRAVALKLTTLILQVRPGADALYASALEPWSESLTGTQGQAPEPFYDPLAMWIEQAHARGLELHAWFNPFRARPSQARSAPAALHLSQTQPQWIRRYGDQLWIDPAEPAAVQHTLAVIQDVLTRYDVDGIHLDDYFYPYPVVDPLTKAEIDFPDEPGWQRYRQEGGTLSRADWRRDNVNQLVQRLYQMVRASGKPWVQLGISPFGIPKPSLRPTGITGMSQYDKLYADVELWLTQGWLDYLLPQLYWPMAQPPQAFGVLLDYWHRQNPLSRHVWAGLFTSRVIPAGDKADGWPVSEISGQIALQRSRAPGTGHGHFSMVALMQNRRGLADTLAAEVYAEAALPPATPWLDPRPPAPLPPLLMRAATDATAASWQLSFAPAGNTPAPQRPAARVLLWTLHGTQWRLYISPGEPDRCTFTVPAQNLTGLVVAGLSRSGVEGPRQAYRLGD
ncbi:glycoside hydrolase family 10 protein [Roseateles koreensis]|uniref:Family 10 glycosylhydrolase n=1 Tax=Roseateles koreensis TaxID=2987526 RepID=A0ABT5KPJ8_9BURK|nr:family 10 glycosylhydrolase [Roseateles koreensis]MDC8784847.1 family 10 glycosylhydrolase [Roseateles koreensis]